LNHMKKGVETHMCKRWRIITVLARAMALAAMVLLAACGGKRSGVVPLAVKARSKEEAFYHSLIVVPKDSPVQSVQELKGKTFLFSAPASTSGHLFPRALLIELLGITNEEVKQFFGNVLFSGVNDKSILAIA